MFTGQGSIIFSISGPGFGVSSVVVAWAAYGCGELEVYVVHKSYIIAINSLGSMQSTKKDVRGVHHILR